jgi:ribosomal protein L12E/L44/L45/RPP1/RPP2
MRPLQSKEKLLTDLRKELAISTQEHFEVLSAVMQDKEIESLRENRAPEPGAAPGAAADAGAAKRKKEALGSGAGRCCATAAQRFLCLWASARLGSDQP